MAATTVLLVDDEAVVRRATRRVLERAGFVVIEAENGKEALDRFTAERERLALIVLDVTMPVMGGAEAFGRIRDQDGDRIPVIVSSGHEPESGDFRGDRVAFLAKPFRPSQLLELVQRMVNGA